MARVDGNKVHFLLYVKMPDPVYRGIPVIFGSPRPQENCSAPLPPATISALPRPCCRKRRSPLLDRSEVRAVLHIPAGFSKDILTEQTAKVQLLTDGTDSNNTSIVLGYAGFIINDYNDAMLQISPCR